MMFLHKFEQREREREKARERENFKSHIVNGVLKLLDIFMGVFVSTETSSSPQRHALLCDHNIVILFCFCFHVPVTLILPNSR